MHITNIKSLLVCTGLLLMSMPSFSQNTNSPYSRYGYGVLSDRSIGASKAMGGISYGLRDQSTNPSNPASYTAIDSLTFIFDIGVSYVPSRYKEGKETQNNENGGLDYIVMHFPIAKKFAMSIGLLPFSSVGYDFGSTQTDDKGTKILTTFEGSGGFSQVYAGLAFDPIKNLSVGANISYLFGNTTYKSTLNILNTAEPSSEYNENKLTINALKLDFGAQYELKLENKDKLIFGAVYSPKVSKNQKIVKVKSKYTPRGRDKPNETINSYTGDSAKAQIASNLGLGFTWKHKNNITVGADITYQNWSKADYSSNMDDGLTKSNRFNDRWLFNTGIEYAIAPSEREFIKKVKFRGGLNFSNSYVNAITNNNEIGKYKEYGATLGFGLPIRTNSYTNRTSYINIAFEYKKLNPNKSHMIKEEYYGITLGVNFNEMWFLKNKFK